MSQVHNDAVKRSGVLISVLVMSCMVLSGCSESSEDPGGSADGTSSATPTPTPTPTPTEPPYLPVPAGVALTEQGSALALGDEAVVAYRPRQGAVGVLTIAVKRIERTTFKASFAGWKLDGKLAAMTPYFVRATLTNTGTTDLGGRAVPLYGVDSSDRLIESSTFKGSFTPCPSLPFPKRFPAGATHQACLVYLAPARRTVGAVAFRPAEEFNPISWTGAVTTPGADKPKDKPKNKPKDKGNGGKGGA